MTVAFNQDSEFRGFIDLTKNELRNARVHNLSSAPGTPVGGQIYFDTVTKKFQGFDETDWIDLGGSGGANISETIINAKGDIIVGTADDTPVRKAVGANNTFLSPNSALGDGLEWRVLGDGDIPAGIMRDAEHTLAAHQELIATPDLTDWPRTADLDFAGVKITSLGNGIADTDAINLAQARAILDGHDNKTSVRAGSTVNVVLATALENGDTAGGVVLATNDRFLAAGQTDGSENGIYIVQAAGAAVRATDADISAEVTAGLTVFVSEGTHLNKTFQLFTDDPIVLGTTVLDFQPISAAGQITAGAGLTKTGDVIDVVGGAAFGTGGPGGGVVINANEIVLDKSKVARNYTQLFGNGVLTSFNIDHNLGTKRVLVQIFLDATGAEESCEKVRSTINRVVLSGWTVAPGADAYAVVIVAAD